MCMISSDEMIVCREKIIGNVVLNFCDSDSPVRSIVNKSEGSVIGGNSPYDHSNLHHVFSLCGWFEVDTTSHKLIRRIIHRPSKTSASNAKGSVGQPSSPSSANLSTSSSAIGSSLKNKSVVAASTAAPREDCSNPQLNLLINISRRFVT